jgi:4-amino-4-deoxy-L-arabinose transferase-like glycosyltransferase
VTTQLEHAPALAAPPPTAQAGPRFRPTYLAALLVATAVLYLWNITINGMGNQFYAAATQAGSRNWEALLFGSLDPQNFITVDKPPLSQWVMGLSGQLFGFSSASMLIPQALMAVAAVALTYAAVARIGGRWAGLLAGAALAVTPVAVLMFRFNNPDAAMVLSMTAAAYCTVRALDHRGARWLAMAGAAVGLAFLAKMLEGVMVMPALGAAYLLAAPVGRRLRLLHLLGAGAAFVASAGWFVLLTLMWPASARPYLAGSADNNFMNLVLGYNGFARVLGHSKPSFTPPPSTVGTYAGSQFDPPKTGFGGLGNQTPGWMRLVSGEFGYEIGWLLPTALVATVLVVVARGRAPRTDLVRAGAVLFGGWLLFDALVLTMMHGMTHAYYSLSIAPPIAGMFALGVQQAWVHRESRSHRTIFAAVLLATGVFNWWILDQNASWLPALRQTILALTVTAALVLCSGRLLRARPAVATAMLAMALVGTLAGPAAYAIATVGVSHQGGGPTVGPGQAGPRGGMWGKGVDSQELDDMLKQADTKWSAAIERSTAAAGLELSSETAVMAIGGFSGTDPAPTLAQFQDDVAKHQVAYYLSTTSGSRRPGWNSHPHADIARWVADNFRAIKVGKATVYDLAQTK